MKLLTNIKTFAYNKASLMAFIRGATGDELDAAFGKNFEDYEWQLGQTLALYAYFLDESINITSTFPNLILCDNIYDIQKSSSATLEFFSNSSLRTLINSSRYASGILVESLISKSITTSSSSNAAVTSTLTLSVTDKHLNGEEFLLFDAYITDARDYGTSYITINGYTLLTLYSGTKSFVKVADSNDFATWGITTPGNYDIVLRAETGSKTQRATARIYVTSTISYNRGE